MQDNDVAGAKLPGGHSRGTIIQAIPAQHGSAFHLLPKRWVIERTFAWLGRNRRLAKDLETLVETSTAMAAVGIVQLLVRAARNRLTANNNFLDRL